MKHMGSAGANSRSSSGVKRRGATGSGYLLCIDNRGYEASLDVGKVYRAPAASKGVPEHWVRVIDESGEDYVFPEGRFVRVELPLKARRALATVAAK